MTAPGDQPAPDLGAIDPDLGMPAVYTVTIQRLGNGYCVMDSEGQTAVVQEPEDHRLDDNTAKARGFVDLAELLCEWLGCWGSRYDAERVWIELKPGDKHEAPAAPGRARKGRERTTNSTVCGQSQRLE